MKLFAQNSLLSPATQHNPLVNRPSQASLVQSSSLTLSLYTIQALYRN